jgi:hypothetical protein
MERALTPVALHFSQDFLQVIDFYRESPAGDPGSVFCKLLIYKEILESVPEIHVMFSEEAQALPDPF